MHRELSRFSPWSEADGWTRLARSTFVQPALVWLLRTFKSHSAVPEAALLAMCYQNAGGDADGRRGERSKKMLKPLIELR